MRTRKFLAMFQRAVLFHKICIILCAVLLFALVTPASVQASEAAMSKELQIAQSTDANETKKQGRSLMDFGERRTSDQVGENATTLKQTSESSKNQSERSLWQSITIWINQKQIILTKTLTSYLKQFKETNDYSFAIILIGLSFLYGLVHAAGPGHGKVVVSSYVMANDQTMKRGIFLSFLSSLVQGTVAVSLVAIPAFIFSASGTTIKKLGLQFTQVSYILIILLGMYLLYSLIYRKWKSRQTHSEHHHHNHTHTHAHTHSHSHDHDHTHNHHHSHEHHHAHDHHDECGCGHSHIPSAHEVQGKWDIAKIISLVLSVGLRPCTGALYVLALALIKGVFWVGVVSVYAMALGTAITISLVTMAVVGGRQVAFVTSSGNSRFGSYLYDVCTMGGAIVIILFGSLLLSSSFTPITPF